LIHFLHLKNQHIHTLNIIDALFIFAPPPGGPWLIFNKRPPRGASGGPRRGWTINLFKINGPQGGPRRG